jgi:hypothetical protein
MVVVVACGLNGYKSEHWFTLFFQVFEWGKAWRMVGYFAKRLQSSRYWPGHYFVHVFTNLFA